MTSKAAAAIEEMALRDHPNSACHNGMASEREPRTVKAKASVTKPSATTLQPLGNRRSADDHEVGIAGSFQSNSAFDVRQGVPAWLRHRRYRGRNRRKRWRCTRLNTGRQCASRLPT